MPDQSFSKLYELSYKLFILHGLMLFRKTTQQTGDRFLADPGRMLDEWEAVFPKLYLWPIFKKTAKTVFRNVSGHGKMVLNMPFLAAGDIQ